MFPSVLKIKIAVKYFHMDFGGEFESVHSLFSQDWLRTFSLYKKKWIYNYNGISYLGMHNLTLASLSL